MSETEIFFNLFNENKYREIESDIASIISQHLSREKFLCLLDSAIAVTKSDVFKIDNSGSDYEYYLESLSDKKEIFQSDEYFRWVSYDSDRHEIVDMITTLLCYPRYKIYSHKEIRSDIYVALPWGLDSLNMQLYNTLDNCAEHLPSNIIKGIYSREQISRLTELFSHGYSALCDPENILYSISTKSSFITFDLLNAPPSVEDLEGKYYASIDRESRDSFMYFYSKMLEFLTIVNLHGDLNIVREIHI